ncbi:MAG: 3-dehydroquinate synthase [Sphingobacteriales bacterium JAD_PAG50586_3]|nr:MAG: 3-dehydroquinate synthase [Sphingobacteriales bacterium JAD_PAG50586_3]
MHIPSTGYSIYHSNGVFAQLQAFIEERYPTHSIVVLVDDNTFELCLPVVAGYSDSIANAEVIEIPSGEANKTLENVQHIWESLTGLGIDRNTLLINLGGGLVSDMGGFAASTFKRGIPFINIPTSLLAMVDASVGGKTGFDFNGIKNHIGLFTNPQAVFVDPVFLNSLPERELYSGFAEMIKHALIADAGLWAELKNINPTNADDVARYIPRSIEIKNTLVTSDPFDNAARKALNFGHTFGHAIESYFIGADNELLHGEAIAIGMVCESFVAVEKGLITPTVLKEIEELIATHFSFAALDEYDEEAIMVLMGQDKKNSSGNINMALIAGIGSCQTNIAVGADEIKKALHYCKALSY